MRAPLLVTCATTAALSLGLVTPGPGSPAPMPTPPGASSGPAAELALASPNYLNIYTAPDSSTLTQYLMQQPAWGPCAGHDASFDCTKITVPVDYTNPNGPTIALAVNRLKATGPDSRLGSLLTNPGGPGGSGLEMIYDGSEELKNLNDRYDLIGIDPRGVGESEGIVCLADYAKDAFYQNDFTPTTPDGAARMLTAAKAYADSCEVNSGKILPYVGTENAARDLEVVHTVLGDAKLNYFGVSYGTRLGQAYADQYPRNVGRMVLDSVDDPGATPSRVDDSTSPEDQLNRIYQLCARQAGAACRVGADPVAAARRFDTLLTSLASQPVVANGRTLTASLARLAAFQATYDPMQFGPHFVDGIVEAEQGGNASLLTLSDMYLDRGRDGRYGNTQEAFLAIKNLEGDPAQPTASSTETAAALQEAAQQSAVSSPHFGPLLVYLNAVGSFWPVRPTGEPRAVQALGSAPILLVNDTRDTATPLASAQRVEKQLANAVLVSNDADGHGAYGRGSCITKVVDDYLDAGTVPARGTACKGTAG